MNAKQLDALPEWARPLAMIPYAGTFWATKAVGELDSEHVMTPEHTEPVCTTYPYAPAALSAELIAKLLNDTPRLCEALADALLDEKDIRGDLAVAIDIFHEAGQTHQWHHKWDEDVAALLAKHWPVTKSRRRHER